MGKVQAGVPADIDKVDRGGGRRRLSGATAQQREDDQPRPQSTHSRCARITASNKPIEAQLSRVWKVAKEFELASRVPRIGIGVGKGVDAEADAIGEGGTFVAVGGSQSARDQPVDQRPKEDAAENAEDEL